LGGQHVEVMPGSEDAGHHSIGSDVEMAPGVNRRSFRQPKPLQVVRVIKRKL